MKVRFQQSGGYTGLSLGAEIDTDTLPRQEADRLEALVEQSGIGSLNRSDEGTARDLGQYRITIEGMDGSRTAEYDDMSMPDRLMPLHEYLQSHARPRPPG